MTEAPKSTSVYLTEEDKEMLDELMTRHGLSRSSVFRLGIRKLYEDGSDVERVMRLRHLLDEMRELIP